MANPLYTNQVTHLSTPMSSSPRYAVTGRTLAESHQRAVVPPPVTRELSVWTQVARAGTDE